VRIIAGQFRSRPLKAVPGEATRPTSDRLRETLFNVLQAMRLLEGTVFLDVFAGTGAVGIEALSRGARQVYFVEQAKKAAAVIRENLRSLGMKEGFEVMERDSNQALRMLDSSAVRSDFCFIDPPYADSDAYEETLGFLSQSRLLTPESVVVAEHDKRNDLDNAYGALARFRKLVQGDAALSFYRLP
jgi:16S rRNA (guanine(966)-N(2))-methyltransferase RsmD